MARTADPYLAFKGNCGETFGEYRSVFGEEFGCTGQCRDFPGRNPLDQAKEKIRHISLPLTGHVSLRGAGVSELYGSPNYSGNPVRLILCTASQEETDRLIRHGLGMERKPFLLGNTF